VEVPAIEGTRGARTMAGLMPLGLFLFLGRTEREILGATEVEKSLPSSKLSRY